MRLDYFNFIPIKCGWASLCQYHRYKEDEVCLEYAIQTGGLIVTNDKFRIVSPIFYVEQMLIADDFLADIRFENWKRNREDFVRSAHDRFNYANQDMTMCRKRIIEHFFTGPSSIDLTWVKNFCSEWQFHGLPNDRGCLDSVRIALCLLFNVGGHFRSEFVHLWVFKTLIL